MKSKLLTALLLIAVIIVLGGATAFGVRMYQDYVNSIQYGNAAAAAAAAH